MENNGIKNIVSNGENIGVIGSPSSTSEITIDILGTAVDKKLVGNLCTFEYRQENRDQLALGQIVEVQMQNIWAQDPTMRELIRQRGRVEPVTERQDVHTANLMVSAVFTTDNNKVIPSMLGTVPATGTSIKLVDEEIMSSLFSDYNKDLFYLGRVYGNIVKMPMWFKHFGSVENKGLGEGQHIGVFGKTGSGKSVLAKMIITAYCKHPEMSIFILDPQGEFSKEFSSETKVGKLLKNNLNRNIKILNLTNLVFDFDKDLFKDLLVASGFFKDLYIWYEDHITRLIDKFLELLDEYKPWDYCKKEAFDLIWNKLSEDDFLKKVIGTKDARERVLEGWNTLNSTKKDAIYKKWAGITNIFKFRGENSTKLKEVLEKTQSAGNLVIIDLSYSSNVTDLIWNEEIQYIAIKQFLSGISNYSDIKYKDNKNINSLVVIDEAHRLAPSEAQSESIEQIKSILIDAIRTTRKAGLGWMFISQTLASMDKEILMQLRTYIFGFGLGWGSELRSLQDLIGGATSAIKLYQLFKDPQSTMGKREFPFMIKGPISPLSFSDSPLFLTALDYPQEFFDVNGIKE